MTGPKPPSLVRESSAGGVVLREGEVLLVQVENLSGQLVWTFPKGHLESAETARQAALREVEEETGWACEIEQPFGEVSYSFCREQIRVQKKVAWFLMRPVKQVGAFDPVEIRACAWVSLGEAGRRVSYPSDRELMKRLKALPPTTKGEAA